MKSGNMPTNDSESDLIKRIKIGDNSALDKILEKYIPQLNAYFHYLHVPEDSIEDLIQETFEKMINKIDTFDESKKFSTWLITIGRNLYIDNYRHKIKGEKILFEEKPMDLPYNPENEVISKLTVEELLKKLTIQEKSLIEMRIFQKMPFADIAEITGEQENTLRSRFFRIIGKIRNSL